MDRLVKILVECPDLIASVRVGVLEPLSYLEEENKCKVVFKRTIQINKKDIEWCDILITVRGYEGITLDIVKAAKRAGRFIIYFLDDDLLNIPNEIPSGKYFNDDVKKIMTEIISNSNLLWCVNSIIGKKYSSFCKDKWILSKVPIEMNRSINNKTEDKVIRILYAGSSDHSGVVQKYLSPAVKNICDEYGSKVHFTFIGADPGLKNCNNVNYIKYFNEYQLYKNFVNNGNFTIGLAIILEKDFYRCKYYNKFIEYTSIGAVGIYTNSEPYSIIVENCVNGILCNNSEWYNTIKNTIDNYDLRQECYANAYDLLKEKFNYQVVGKELMESIPELVTYHAKNVRVTLFNPRTSFYIDRFIAIRKEHKVMFLFIVIFKFVKYIIRRLRNLLGR